MQDIINQLPPNISNQIAAGEVIDRPSSAVKELMENSIDAGATSISLILRNYGKSLIQVIDNGKGMSPNDAVKCFDRHATSKIKTSEDLYNITSKGFRGEALASIASISQVELKTKRNVDITGVQINIENNEILSKGSCSMDTGTNFSLKNIYYNVPARRNFMKSDRYELSKIISEYEKLALSHPDIEFRLFHNDLEISMLKPSTLKKRIIGVFGKNYEEKLVDIAESSDIIKVYGFVCKPKDANSKNKSKQYIFVNKRFIKSKFISHAVYKAYSDMINVTEYPFFVLFVDIDTKLIDINVHPNKTEIKFEDEQLVYGFLNSGIKKSLMKYNLGPSIDFSIDPTLNNLDSFIKPIFNNKDIQTDNQSSITTHRPRLSVTSYNNSNWREIFEKSVNSSSNIDSIELDNESELFKQGNVIPELGHIKIKNNYIFCSSNQGIYIIHLRRAFETITYHRLSAKTKDHNSSQKLMFVQNIELSMQDSLVMQEIIEDIRAVGFDVLSLGNNVYSLQGVPAEYTYDDYSGVLEELIEGFKDTYKAKTSKRDSIIKAIAYMSSRNKTFKFQNEELWYFITELFTLNRSHQSPNGKKVYEFISFDDISNYF